LYEFKVRRLARRMSTSLPARERGRGLTASNHRRRVTTRRASVGYKSPVQIKSRNDDFRTCVLTCQFQGGVKPVNDFRYGIRRVETFPNRHLADDGSEGG